MSNRHIGSTLDTRRGAIRSICHSTAECVFLRVGHCGVWVEVGSRWMRLVLDSASSVSDRLKVSPLFACLQ